MPTFNYPYIRDILTIDATVQNFYREFAGDGPVYLLGRIVRHAPGFDLKVGARPLIIVADLYDGNGGTIDARGADGAAGGLRGGDGGYPWPPYEPGELGRPTGPGGGGGGGGPGGSAGSGGSVTVRCRHSLNARIDVSGGNGAGGGAGGNGGPGVNGFTTPDRTIWVDDTPDDPSNFEGHEEFIPGVTVDGTPGGDGGSGGAGGNAGHGGVIEFISIVDDTPPSFEARGGVAGPGGPGGAAGANGSLSGSSASDGPPGIDGEFGTDGQVTHFNVSEADYVAGLRGVLDGKDFSYANYWAPFRIVTGEYFHHRYNASVPERAHFSVLAATEYARALELQPDNSGALRLQAQLVGVPQAVPGTADVVWLGGGNNALGLSPNLDVLPNFDAYITAYVAFANLALELLAMGTDSILAAGNLFGLQTLVEQQKRQAMTASANIQDELDIANTEKKLAGDDADFLQRQLNQVVDEINAAMAQMRDSQFTFGDFIGTVAEIGVAVVGIVAAIPSGGASLVALVPAIVALSDRVMSDAQPIAKAVLGGTAADTAAVEEAYEKVDKKASSVVKAGSTIVNFVKVVERLTASTTPANAGHVALVKRGAELAHQLMMARNRVVLGQQRIDATQAKLERAKGTVIEAEVLSAGLTLEASTIRRAGLLAVGVARAKADALMGLAFRAQRSLEIYTLQKQEQHLFLDAGLIRPEISRAYQEEEISDAALVAELVASWSLLLEPIGMKNDYASYFDRPHDQDRLRLSFGEGSPQLESLRRTRRLSFRVDAASLPAGRADAKVSSVRLALVGASHPAGEVSCEVRHGATYEQRRADGTITVQLLEPRISTRPAKLDRLNPDEGLGFDPPLEAPQSLAFWGRGIGGDWEVAVPGQLSNAKLSLKGVTQVQVWIGYQFLR